MLHKVRLGDILLCKNEQKTNAYLLTWDDIDGYTLMCLSCGEKVGCYKRNKDLLKHDMENYLNVTNIIPKEIMSDLINNTYKLKSKMKPHDTINKYRELNIEFEIE